MLISLDTVQRFADDAVSQRVIARAAGLDEVTTSQVLRRLEEERGLVDRGPTFEDTRTWRVMVSSSGRELLLKARLAIMAVSQSFFARWLE